MGTNKQIGRCSTQMWSQNAEIHGRSEVARQVV